MSKIIYGVAAASVFCVKKATDILRWGGAVSLGAFLGRAGYLLPSRQKRIAFENLEKVFGNRCAADYAWIAAESFENMGKGFFEALASGRLSEGRVKSLVAVSGEEHLSAALDKGRGVIGVSAHMGNFTFIGIKLAADGYRFNYVFKYPKLRFLADVIRLLGEHHKVGFIPALPRRESARKAIKSLRKNEIVCILCDQHAPGGVRVEFFNEPASTAAGPVVLAIRTGAAIVPMFSRRTAAGRHEVVIEPEFELDAAGDYAADILNNTRRLNEIIERRVRAHPSQWWWVHRRWKPVRRMN